MNPGMEGTPPRILVVIPAYQEERSIGGLVRSLRGRYCRDALPGGRAAAGIGSRFLGETEYRGSIPRIFGIRFFRLLVNLTTGYRVTDPTSGFFAINRRLGELDS